MGNIVLHHGSGAQDFEVVGPALGAEELRRVLFNARQVLTVRDQHDAIALLDTTPFGIFPAINHFNDEFEVLLAKIPLQEYEAVRRNQEGQRTPARQIAEAVAEVGGPPVRFVAVSLRTVAPEAWDVFLCHASEDKAAIARPIYGHLISCGIHCWLDEAEIAWGDGIVSKVQEGLARARFVVIILSPHFLQKNWPKRELETALNLEIEANRSLVLHLLSGDPGALLSSLPFLKAKRYLIWSNNATVVEEELRTLVRRQARQEQ